MLQEMARQLMVSLKEDRRVASLTELHPSGLAVADLLQIILNSQEDHRKAIKKMLAELCRSKYQKLFSDRCRRIFVLCDWLVNSDDEDAKKNFQDVTDFSHLCGCSECCSSDYGWHPANILQGDLRGEFSQGHTPCIDPCLRLISKKFPCSRSTPRYFFLLSFLSQDCSPEFFSNLQSELRAKTCDKGQNVIVKGAVGSEVILRVLAECDCFVLRIQIRPSQVKMHLLLFAIFSGLSQED